MASAACSVLASRKMGTMGSVLEWIRFGVLAGAELGHDKRGSGNVLSLTAVFPWAQGRAAAWWDLPR
jgi:hypothetical protein